VPTHTAASVRSLGERFAEVAPSAVSKASSRFAERLARETRLAARIRGCVRAIEQMSNVKT